jgi:hypothetical protein
VEIIKLLTSGDQCVVGCVAKQCKQASNLVHVHLLVRGEIEQKSGKLTILRPLACGQPARELATPREAPSGIAADCCESVIF